MRQLQDNQRIIYIEDDRPEYQVVHVRRRNSRPRMSYGNMAMLPFWLGTFAFVLLAFVVTDVDWLLRRAAAALVVLLIAGGIGVTFIAIRDAFTGEE